MTRSLVPPELLDPIAAYFRPRRVILFGSHARGDARSDSDIDLLVVVDDDTPAEKVTLKAGVEAQRSYPNPADVIPVREETVTPMANWTHWSVAYRHPDDPGPEPEPSTDEIAAGTRFDKTTRRCAARACAAEGRPRRGRARLNVNWRTKCDRMFSKGRNRR